MKLFCAIVFALMVSVIGVVCYQGYQARVAAKKRAHAEQEWITVAPKIADLYRHQLSDESYNYFKTAGGKITNPNSSASQYAR